MAKIEDWKQRLGLHLDSCDWGTVEEDIPEPPFRGRVNFQSTSWPARADHAITAGDTVRVVGLNGITLLVKRISHAEITIKS